jgi:hypothetical protein
MNTYIDTEHDKTIAFGEKTLYVEGLCDWDELNNSITPEVKHIHFGSNDSFDGHNLEKWESLIHLALKTKLWVTLEFDATYSETVIECGFNEKHNFIPKIKINLPYIVLLNYHTVIKIDDKKQKSNPGTWTTYLSDLMDHDAFTPGKFYVD